MTTSEVMRFACWPFEYMSVIAEMENDVDVACGLAVTGFELDIFEEAPRRHRREVETSFFFGTTAALG